MKFIISKEIADAYPHLRIAIVVASDISVANSSNELEKLKRICESKIKAKYSSSTLTQHPFIVAWRDIYRSFGSKPKKYNPAAEALIRRILHNNPIPCINTLVDSYLLIEANSFLPIGGYDLEKVLGNIHLRYSTGNEGFIPIGAQGKEVTYPGEVIYADESNVLTRRWNYKDCDYTKITLHTRQVALFIEAADNRIPTYSLLNAAENMKEMITRFCGGKTKIILAYPHEEQVLEWKL